MPGPAPLPTAIKELKGNPGKRPLNDDHIKVPKASDTRPPMKLYGSASEEWYRIMPVLHRLGLLTDLDTAALAAYCEAWGRYQEAVEIVRSEGLMVYGYRGQRIKNPMISVARGALDDAKRIMVEFGMTPSSRGRMYIPGAEDENDGADELDRMLG